MSNGATNANVNPLDPGNDANSVENAAHSFDTLFGDVEPDTFPEEEGQPEPRKRKDDAPRRSERKAPDPDSGDDSEADDNGDDHEDEDDHKDPILDDTPSKDDDDKEKDDEGDQDDEDDDEADDDEDDGELDWEREIPVTINGETKNLPLSEVVAGYSMEADYRQKTEALSNDRQEFEGYVEDIFTVTRHFSDTVKNWVELTKSMEPSEEDWNTLKAKDPTLFIQMKEQWEGISKKRGEAEEELRKATELEEKENVRQYNNWVREQNTKLAEKIPALRNPKKAEAFRRAIMTYGKAAGYSVEEIAKGAIDHRDVITLYKASRYDEIMASRKSGNRGKPGKGAPKASQPSRPRSIGRTSNVDSRKARQKADDRLRRSGSVDDAAMAFTEMLKS